jgi:hypothetical protein
MKKFFRSQVSLSRWAPLIGLAITILGWFLRTYQLGSKGLWLDEAFSVWLGEQTIPRLLEWILKVDQHPPLYYSLLNIWIHLTGNSSPENVRLLSAIFGTLTIPVIYLIGKRLSGDTMGLAAALILALSPFHVRFAQETRMYTLLTLNASLAIYALSRLLTDPRLATPFGAQLAEFYQTWRSSRRAELEKQPARAGYTQDFRGKTDWVSAPTRRRWLPIRTIETDLSWLALIVFTVATMLSHNTAILFPVAVNVFVFGWILSKRIVRRASSPQRTTLQNWLLAQLGVFLLWSPWLYAFITQAQGVYQEFWIPPPDRNTVLDTLKTFLNDFLPRQIQWDEIIWLIFIFLAILGVLHFRRRPAHLFLLLTLFVTPIVAELLVSLERPIFYDRTLIWTTIPLYLLLAAGIAQLHYRPYVLAACVILATTNFLSVRDYYQYFEKEQWNLAADYVAKNVQTEDLILFNATWVQIPFDYYFRTYNRPVDEHGAPVDLFDRGILEPKMAASDLPRLRSLMRGRERIWLVYSHNWYTDPKNLIPPALSEELKLLETRDYYGLQVQLYGVP